MPSKESKMLQDIIGRCTNPNHRNFARYGGRNISVYPLWLNDHKAFFDYIKTLEHYGEEGYSLDRIDNNKGYEPGNLRFATAKTQARNKRNNLFAHYCGQKMLLIDIAEITGIKYATLEYRHRKGLDNEELIKPVKRRLPKSELVLIQDNAVYVDSRKVAEYFEKEHFHVMRDIEEIVRQLNVETAPDIEKPKLDFLNFDKMFVKGEYEVAGQTRKYPMYYLNRDGFMLLTMGFTGQKAFHFKLLFLNEFNRMEQALSKKSKT